MLIRYAVALKAIIIIGISILKGKFIKFDKLDKSNVIIISIIPFRALLNLFFTNSGMWIKTFPLFTGSVRGKPFATSAASSNKYFCKFLKNAAAE